VIEIHNWLALKGDPVEQGFAIPGEIEPKN